MRLSLTTWGALNVRERLDARLTALDTKEDSLLDLAADGDLPKEKIKEKLIAIRDERASIRRDIERLDAELETGRAVFGRGMETYGACPESNAVIYGRFFGTLSPPRERGRGR
jgi:hypothetical protein